MKTAKKRILSSRKEVVNNEHLTELAEKLQRKNLEIIKRQNRNYVKQRGTRKRRNSSESDESEGERIAQRCYEEWLQEEAAKPTPDEDCDDDDQGTDKVAEECYEKWRKEEYDSYSAVNRKTLLSNIKMFEKMMKAKKKVECGSMTLSTDNIIKWTSPTFLARYIRKCILRHEWTELAHLLLLLTKHSHLYESYTREMTFLTTLMNVSKCEKDLLEDLELCFVMEKAQEAKEFDVWYVHKSDDTQDLQH